MHLGLLPWRFLLSFSTDSLSVCEATAPLLIHHRYTSSTLNAWAWKVGEQSRGAGKNGNIQVAVPGSERNHMFCACAKEGVRWMCWCTHTQTDMHTRAHTCALPVWVLGLQWFPKGLAAATAMLSTRREEKVGSGERLLGTAGPEACPCGSKTYERGVGIVSQDPGQRLQSWPFTNWSGSGPVQQGHGPFAICCPFVETVCTSAWLWEHCVGIFLSSLKALFLYCG